MKKNLLLLAIIMCIVNIVFADVSIGTGTEVSKCLPIEPWYGYSYSQVIYLQSEIDASGDVTEISWDFAGNTLANSNDWTIYLGHTTKTQFDSDTDWVDISTLTEVWSGEFTDPGAPGILTFDITDFYYNNIDNLIIAVDENVPGLTEQSTADFYCTAVPNDRAIEVHSDSNNPDPQVPPTAYYGNPIAYIANIVLTGLDISEPPASASFIAPADDAIRISATGTLSWNETPGATGYYLYLGTDGNGITDPTNIINGNDLGDVTSYNYSDLDFLTTHYWKIVPYNSFGNASDCYIWEFETSTETAVLFTIDLIDDYNDGWNGGLIDIFVEDILVFDDITLASAFGGGPATFAFCVDDDETVFIDYTEGTSSYQNEYYIYNDGGVLIAQSGADGEIPEDITIIVETADYGSLDGYVTESENGVPIEGATVEVDGQIGITNISGYFEISNILVGSHDITSSAFMYIPQTVQSIVFNSDSNLSQDFVLDQSLYYFNDFEDNNGSLISNNPSGWTWGEAIIGEESAYSGTNLWRTTMGGDYENNANWTLDATIPVGITSSLYKLEFWHCYAIETEWDGGNVKISIDAGDNWTLIEPTTGYPYIASNSNSGIPGEPCFSGTQAEWTYLEFDLSGYEGENILVRWHFGSDASNDGGLYPGWLIDDVRIYEQVFGSLEGIVTESGSGNPISDAEITIGSHSTTSDATGYYSIDGIPVRGYDVKCEQEFYATTIVEDVMIEADIITTQNISMLWSEIAVNVTELASVLGPNESGVQTFIITNDGESDLEYKINYAYPEEAFGEYIPKPNYLPHTTNYIRKNNKKPSTGIDVSAFSGNNLYEPSTEIFRGSMAWFKASENSEHFCGSFDTDTPEVMSETASAPTWRAFSGDFDSVNTDFFYVSNSTSYNISKIDCVTGAETLLGSTGIPYIFYGMACDKTTGIMYGTTGYELYTINLSSGAATLVGEIGNTGGIMLTLACDGIGDLWGIDLVYDTLWHIDKNTGIGTEIGELGFDADYAQSMAWDPSSNILYWAAYGGGGSNGNLRIIDTNTGASTLAGDFENGRQVTVLAFPGVRDTWISTTNNVSGIVPANGGSVEVEVTFDATDLLAGDVLTANLLILNSANYIANRGDDYVIPVTLTVSGTDAQEDAVIFATELFDNYPNPFNPTTTINYNLAEENDVILEIYNIKGQKVNSLVNDLQSAGKHSVIWSGTDENNKLVSSGLYFYKLRAGSKIQTKKMIMIK